VADYLFGVDIGGTTVKMGLFTMEGELKDKWEIVTRKDGGGELILPDIAESIRQKMAEKSIEREQVKGIGMGVPGPVRDDGTVIKCANLGWGVFNAAEKMSELMEGMLVKVGNDANMAALGEYWQGGGKQYSSMVMVTLGTGVGGGIIINGKMLAGTNGAGGEIGHITVDFDETDVCGCGKRGCLEQFASATGIVRITRKALAESSKPSKLREIELTAKDIFDVAKDGDELALEMVETLGQKLGYALSIVADTVDPEAFVIGGGVSRAGSILTETIGKYYREYVFHACRDTVFELATLGNDAGIYGGAAAVTTK